MINLFDKIDWKTFYPEFSSAGDAYEYFRHYSDFAVAKSRSTAEAEWMPKGEKDELYKACALCSIDLTTVPFSSLVLGFVRPFYRKIVQEAVSYEFILDPELFSASVSAHLAMRLSNLTTRVAIREFHEYCRLSKQVTKSGSDESYTHYNNVVLNSRSTVQALCEKYPVMRDAIGAVVAYELSYVREMLHNLESSYQDILSTFSIGKDDHLVKLVLEAGDTHRNGKTVAILIFENSKLVYKPRMLRTEKVFNSLCDFVNKKAMRQIFGTIALLDGSSFGFMEYVQERPCVLDSEFNEYFRNLGSLLALLYCINATDCHFENIIADGSSPYLVDAETLFYPDPPGILRAQSSRAAQYGMTEILDHIEMSVTGIGVLPNKIVFAGKPIDLSSISVKKDIKGPIKVPVVCNRGQDNISIEYDYPMIGQGAASNGVLSDLALTKRHKEQLIDGFIEVYKIVMSHSLHLESLLASWLVDADIRYIPKPSAVYANLLSITSHPEIMESSVKKTALLSRIGLNDDLELGKAEVASLWYCDIPYFTIRYNSLAVESPDGNVVRTLSRTPKDRLQKKLHMLSLSDMAKQVEGIEASFYSEPSKKNLTGFQWRTDEYASCSFNTVSKAKEMVDYLVDSRSFAECDSSGKKVRYFLGSVISKTNEDVWNDGLLSMDLYDGNAGLALLFKLLYLKTFDSKYSRIAIECVRPFSCEAFSMTRTGFHNGIGGQIFALSKTLDLDTSGELSDLMKKTINDCRMAIPDNTANDFVEDNIGLAFALSTLLKNDDGSLPFGKSLKNLLDIVGEAILSYYGSGANAVNSIRYSGFAHGMASVLPCVFRLNCLTGDSRYLSLFEKLLERDRSAFFDSSSGYWVDGLDRQRTSRGWCHGTPGVLLGRAILYQEGFTDEKLLEEVRMLTDRVIGDCFGNGLSYCHGDLGNLAILKYVSTVTGDRALSSNTVSNYRRLCDSILGSFLSAENESMSKKYSGIMVGLAGVAHSLLSIPSDSPNMWFLAL